MPDGDSTPLRRAPVVIMPTDPRSYPFASPYSQASNTPSSSSPQMASLGSNAQRRYFPQQANSPSTANLIPPSARSSAQSLASDSSGGHGPVQANFPRGPQSLRSMASNNSMVRVTTLFLQIR